MSAMDGTKALDLASLPFGQGSHTASCKSNIISERERFFAVHEIPIELDSNGMPVAVTAPHSVGRGEAC